MLLLPASVKMISVWTCRVTMSSGRDNLVFLEEGEEM